MLETLRSFRLILCTFLFSVQLALAQSELQLQVRSQDASEVILNRYKFKQKHPDSLSVMRTLNELVAAMHNDGYLLARVTATELKEQIVAAQLEIGPAFKSIDLSPGNVDPLLLRKVAYRRNSKGRDRFNYRQLADIENELLRYAERNGHPFASLRYDSLTIADDQIGASLNLELGPQIRFDSIRVNKEVVKRRFFESYRSIQMGELYDELTVERTVQRIRNLPYVRLVKSPDLSFQNEEATLYFELEKRRINRVDGIIGFLPRAGNGNGLLITGQFDLDLYNPFFSGKYIGIHWRSPQEKSQNLNMTYHHPNAFRSPVSFKGALDFLKQDTTFTKLDFRIDFDIRVGSRSQLAVFTTTTSSNLLSTSQYDNATALPEFADIDQTLYGLAFSSNRLDDPLLPRRGSNVYLSAGLGNKRINPIATLPSELYAGLALKSVQYQMDLDVQYYVDIRTNWNVKLHANGGWISNENLFQNDAYRIGGLSSIRGFDENYFFATKYLANSVENRFYFESNSYLLLFADFGLLENVARAKERGHFIGFGTGISFETQRGIFNLVYALGSSESTGPVNFASSKIHFGFTTRF